MDGELADIKDIRKDEGLRVDVAARTDDALKDLAKLKKKMSFF